MMFSLAVVLVVVVFVVVVVVVVFTQYAVIDTKLEAQKWINY